MTTAVVGFDAAETLFYNRALADEFATLDRCGEPNLRASRVGAALSAVGGRGLWPEDSVSAWQRVRRWSRFYRLVFTEAGLPAGTAGRLGSRCGALVADPDSYALFDDVIDALDGVAARSLRTCVISNFDPLLPAILDRLGVRDRFETVVTSWDVGAYKPDRRIFDAALGRLNVAAGTVLFVGDSPASDAVGARSAGLAAALLDRAGRHPAFDGPRLTSLHQLDALLDDLAGPRGGDPSPAADPP